MSHLSSDERIRLEQVSYWVREAFSERGHRIGEALERDPAFSDGELGRSSLARLLMRRALAIATSQVGLGLMNGPGGSVSVQSFDGRFDRRYRARSASKRDDGSFLILSSSDAILEIDGDSMFVEEAWVLGFTLDLNNQIDEMFVAEVVDRIDGNPGELVLGAAYMLSGGPPSGGAFIPTDDDLPGFADEDGDAAMPDAG